MPDCLRLSDTARILLAADAEPRALLHGSTKAESQRLVRDLERLRNCLALSRDVVTGDWSGIARLTRRLDGLTGDSI